MSDVLGERIRSQSEDLARAFVGYRKAFQSASSKDSDLWQKHRKQTRDRTLLHQCRVATLASAANKTALNSLFFVSPWNVCQLGARGKGWRPRQQYLGSSLTGNRRNTGTAAATRSTESCPKSNNRKDAQGRDRKRVLRIRCARHEATKSCPRAIAVMPDQPASCRRRSPHVMCLLYLHQLSARVRTGLLLPPENAVRGFSARSRPPTTSSRHALDE